MLGWWDDEAAAWPVGVWHWCVRIIGHRGHRVMTHRRLFLAQILWSPSRHEALRVAKQLTEGTTKPSTWAKGCRGSSPHVAGHRKVQAAWPPVG